MRFNFHPYYPTHLLSKASPFQREGHHGEGLKGEGSRAAPVSFQQGRPGHEPNCSTWEIPSQQGYLKYPSQWCEPVQQSPGSVKRWFWQTEDEPSEERMAPTSPSPSVPQALPWHGVNWLCHMLQCVTGSIAQPGPLMSAGIYFSDNNRNRNSFVGYIQMDEDLALQSPSFTPFLVVKDEIV